MGISVFNSNTTSLLILSLILTLRFFKYLSSGAIRREIEKNNKKEIGLYQTKDKILVGYNAYTDENLNKNTSLDRPDLFRNNFRIETF